MPWSELKPMDQRVLFIADYLRQLYCFRELCERFGISRKTGYKWVERYQSNGLDGLSDRSRQRHQQERIPSPVRAAILELRQRGGGELGPKKLQCLLKQQFPGLEPPSRTSIYNILKQAGQIRSRRRRQRVPAHAGPLVSPHEPNGLWSADYKGQFRTGDGHWCYPLTVLDHASRYLLGCQGLRGTTLNDTRKVFERLFREYGLPARIRSDNGVPFASVGNGGLSRLAIWWLKLGIVPERIARGHPEQNGRHERMHRTLKKAVTHPVGATLKAQQRQLDQFRRFYNEERPHEALAQSTPASCYQRSSRIYPERLPKMAYPSPMLSVRVSSGGLAYVNGQRIYVGNLLTQELVGIDIIGDGLWNVYFGPMRLGEVDLRQSHDGYLNVYKVSPM